MDFPNEDEPDGDRFLPHHYLHGAWALALLSVIHEATWVLVFVTLSLFGWYHAWFRYPTVGSLLTLVALTGAFGAALFSPSLGTHMTLVAGIAYLWALDDAVEHATGIWTPLDWLWNQHLRKYVSQFDRDG